MGGDHAAIRIINLTPHRVTVRSGGGEWSFESEGAARVKDSSEPAGEVAGVPVLRISTGEVVGLPDPMPGVTYLVSRVLAAAMPERQDLVFPFGEIRDEGGRIVAVEALGRFSDSH